MVSHGAAMSIVGSNGRPLKDKTLTHNVTVDEAHQIATKIVEHYMEQLPALIETMMTAALTAYDEAKAEKAAHPLATLDQWAERRADEDEETDPAVLVVPGNGTVQ